MKRRFYKKLSLYLCLVLLFCCLPFRVVYASSVQDQSKPIFGLTADDVVSKYNQLSDQQKYQVLRSLGNVSIFANSLFGNIFNSSFGALDDAIEKIGDLFFQANGLIYKLGSSALAWVSRLIDKVFNNNLNDLNISQPVIDDLYRNTYNLLYVSDPFFVNGHLPTYITNTSYLSNFNKIFPIPYNCCFTTSNYGSFVSLSLSEIGSYNVYNCLVVDLDNNVIKFGSLSLGVSVNGGFEVSSFQPSILPDVWSIAYKGFSLASSSNWSDYSGFYYARPYVTFVGSDYLSVLKNFLNTYFVSIDSYVVKLNNIAYQRFIDHSSGSYNVTNNTYYNYIYNIPVETPLNVTNIVSNTAINYDPVENIAYYLPDQYNIEQNFTVVNNYFISSGSAISGQAIDVTLVSPSVIDVRVINPEDISNQVHNEVNNNIINNNNVNFGDLNVKVSVEGAVSHSSDILNDNIDTSNDSPLGFMVAGVPPDLLSIFGAFVVACLVCALCERVFK